MLVVQPSEFLDDEAIEIDVDDGDTACQLKARSDRVQRM